MRADENTRTHITKCFVCFGPAERPTKSSFFVYLFSLKTQKLPKFRHFHATVTRAPLILIFSFLSLLGASCLSNQCHHKFLICIKFLIFFDMIRFLLLHFFLPLSRSARTHFFAPFMVIINLSRFGVLSKRHS